MIPSQPSCHGRPTDRPITVVLDLCLYRVAINCCIGQVLPFGVRQMIKDYAWVSFSYGASAAYALSGDINEWEVVKMTDMSRLFEEMKFNDRIDRWDMRNVTSMVAMFEYATGFNQPLGT